MRHPPSMDSLKFVYLIQTSKNWWDRSCIITCYNNHPVLFVIPRYPSISRQFWHNSHLPAGPWCKNPGAEKNQSGGRKEPRSPAVWGPRGHDAPMGTDIYRYIYIYIYIYIYYFFYIFYCVLLYYIKSY